MKPPPLLLSLLSFSLSALVYSIVFSQRTPLPCPEPPRVSLSPFAKDRLAIIYDPPADNFLIPSLNAILARLPFEWPLRIYIGPAALRLANKSPLFRTMLASNRIQLSPYNTSILTPFHRVFWTSLPRPLTHILLLDTRTVPCRSAPARLDDFWEFGMVGAPWPDEDLKRCPGGGLVLLKKAAVLRAFWGTGNSTFENREELCEALWEVGGEVAPNHINSQFSVSSVYNIDGRPWGVSQLDSFTGTWRDLEKIYSFCPEARIFGSSGRLCPLVAREEGWERYLNLTEYCGKPVMNSNTGGKKTEL